MKTKVFNFSEWHFSEVTSYKIHTFVNFFRRQHLRKPILTSAIAYSRLVALNWNSFPIFNLVPSTTYSFQEFFWLDAKSFAVPSKLWFIWHDFFFRWMIQFSFNAMEGHLPYCFLGVYVKKHQCKKSTFISLVYCQQKLYWWKIN